MSDIASSKLGVCSMDGECEVCDVVFGKAADAGRTDLAAASAKLKLLKSATGDTVLAVLFHGLGSSGTAAEEAEVESLVKSSTNCAAELASRLSFAYTVWMPTGTFLTSVGIT